MEIVDTKQFYVQYNLDTMKQCKNDMEKLRKYCKLMEQSYVSHYKTMIVDSGKNSVNPDRLQLSDKPSQPHDCCHGSKCKRADCKFKHPQGWDAATNMMLQSSPNNTFSLQTWGGGSMKNAMMYVESITFGEVTVPLQTPDTVTFGEVTVSLQPPSLHSSLVVDLILVFKCWIHCKYVKQSNKCGKGYEKI